MTARQHPVWLAVQRGEVNDANGLLKPVSLTSPPHGPRAQYVTISRRRSTCCDILLARCMRLRSCWSMIRHLAAQLRPVCGSNRIGKTGFGNSAMHGPQACYLRLSAFMINVC